MDASGSQKAKPDRRASCSLSAIHVGTIAFRLRNQGIPIRGVHHASWRIHRFGGPEVMAIEAIDRPIPAANEVLIKVFAASVNPVDAKMREGKYPVVTEKDLPYVLGRDVSGQIAAAGDNVSSFLIGDDVFAFLSPEHGGYEVFVLARVDEVAAKPKSLTRSARPPCRSPGSPPGRVSSTTVVFARTSVFCPRRRWRYRPFRHSVRQGKGCVGRNHRIVRRQRVCN
jgi:hypothetical protein